MVVWPVLIDAVHTNEMQAGLALLMTVSKDGCIVMHDVLAAICWNVSSAGKIQKLYFKLILKSSTGIGIAAKKILQKLGASDYFSGDEDEALKFLLKMFKEKTKVLNNYSKNELEMKFPPHRNFNSYLTTFL